VPRGKAPPFRQRLLAALEAARAAGFARVRVSTRDGATFDFDLDAKTAEPTAELNEWDDWSAKRKAKLQSDVQ
jgi:hypothetical protein